jgi:cell division protein FtsI/penicillin-binding protein 2
MNRARPLPLSRFDRLGALRFFFLLLTAASVLRLFQLQILQGPWYDALASGQHAFYEELIPERGTIFVQDRKDGVLYPAATNLPLGFLYADPRLVEDAVATAETIGGILGFGPEQVDTLVERLRDREDPYEPIQREVPEDFLQEINRQNFPGIFSLRQPARVYPEGGLGGHVIGFVGVNEDGSRSGRYGIEGYFDEELSGSPGFLQAERDAVGGLIALGDTVFERAKDGADIVLTIDRNIQYTACRLLDEAVSAHQADGGSVVIVEPKTGAVLALCGSPNFDPNDYEKTREIDVFNNPAIFDAYEPGSIFKPVTLAAALDAGAITPATTYQDTGAVVVDGYEIKNADGEAHGEQSMTAVLEKSLNTGVIFAMEQMGRERFAEYVERFGFGSLTGIELETETPGTIRSLFKPADVYAATATFGQGISVTPLQMAVAFAALANEGKMMQPHVVKEIRYEDGLVSTREPLEIRQVVSPYTSKLVSAMLIAVVENGHGKKAGVSGYYLAGKTGTAEVASPEGGYDEHVTIGSFAGYGPVDDPVFSMVVRIDHPRTVSWAENTAAPLFGKIAEFLLRYLEVPKER